jgi:large subunit ribosomal protein L21
MSFAIFETGGKQYKASASKIIEIEKLEAEVGKTIQFKNVLLLNDTKTTEVGNPNVDGAIVEAKLLDNVKDRTVLIFHKRRRKHSRKMNGHRQKHSKIQITKILSKDGKIIAEAKPIELKEKPAILKKKEKPVAEKKKTIAKKNLKK